MKEDSRINYVELPAEDFSKSKAFYGDVFGWTFQDYGDFYCAFNDGSMDGAGSTTPLCGPTAAGALRWWCFTRKIWKPRWNASLPPGVNSASRYFPSPAGDGFIFWIPTVMNWRSGATARKWFPLSFSRDSRKVLFRYQVPF